MWEGARAVSEDSKGYGGFRPGVLSWASVLPRERHGPGRKQWMPAAHGSAGEKTHHLGLQATGMGPSQCHLPWPEFREGKQFVAPEPMTARATPFVFLSLLGFCAPGHL